MPNDEQIRQMRIAVNSQEQQLRDRWEQNIPIEISPSRLQRLTEATLGARSIATHLPAPQLQSALAASYVASASYAQSVSWNTSSYINTSTLASLPPLDLKSDKIIFNFGGATRIVHIPKLKRLKYVQWRILRHLYRSAHIDRDLVYVEWLRSYLKTLNHENDMSGSTITHIRQIKRQLLSCDPDPLATGNNRMSSILKHRTNIEDKEGLTPYTSTNKGRCVGVEIEFLSPFNKQSIVNMYNSRPVKITCAHLGEDGSVHSDSEEGVLGSSYEFRLLTRIDDMRNLQQLCGFLTEIKAKVNKTCGLHIHLDARGGLRSTCTMIRNLKDAIPFLNSLVPHTRRKGHEFCSKDNSDISWGVNKPRILGYRLNGNRIAKGKRDRNRYSKINTTAYTRHKTIEIRMHSGSVQYMKISNWIKILHSIASHPHKIRISPFTSRLNTYAKVLGWDKELVKYCEKRAALFKNEKKGRVQWKPSSEALLAKEAQLNNLRITNISHENMPTTLHSMSSDYCNLAGRNSYDLYCMKLRLKHVINSVLIYYNKRRAGCSCPNCCDFKRARLIRNSMNEHIISAAKEGADGDTDGPLTPQLREIMEELNCTYPIAYYMRSQINMNGLPSFDSPSLECPPSITNQIMNMAMDIAITTETLEAGELRRAI